MRYYGLVLLAILVLGGSVVSADETLNTTPADVTLLTCDELARETEEDRAFALVFYYGYVTGRENISAIDSEQASQQMLLVRDHCSANPESTLVEAFLKALGH